MKTKQKKEAWGLIGRKYKSIIIAEKTKSCIDALFPILWGMKVQRWSL